MKNKCESEKTRDRGKNYEDQSISTPPVEIAEGNSNFDSIPIEITSIILKHVDVKNLCFFGQTSRENNAVANAILDSYDEVSILLKKLRIKIITAQKGLFFWSQSLNTLYAIGNNELGHLGLGNSNTFNTLTKVQGLSGQIQGVVTNKGITFVWTDEGLFSAGNFGQSYYYNCEHYMWFTKIKDSPNIRSVIFQDDKIYILTDDKITSLKYGSYLDDNLPSFDNVQYTGEPIQTFVPFDGAGTNIIINNRFYRIKIINLFDQVLIENEQFDFRKEYGVKQIINDRFKLFILTQNNQLFVREDDFVGGISALPGPAKKNFNEVTNIPGNIKQIYTMYRRSFVLTDQGLFAFGYNEKRQLDLDHTNEYVSFTKISLPDDLQYPDDIKDVILYSDYMLIVTDTHGLLVAGRNPFNNVDESEFRAIEKEHLSPLNDLLREPEKAKWVLRFSKEGDILNRVWKILSDLVNDGILRNVKVAKRFDRKTQTIFISVLNPTNLKEVMYVYDVLEQHGLLKLHREQEINRDVIHFMSVSDTEEIGSSEEGESIYTNNDLIFLHQLHKQKGMMDPLEFETKWNKLEAALHLQKRLNSNEELEHRIYLLNSISNFQQTHLTGEIQILEDVIRTLRQTLTSERTRSVVEILGDGIVALKTAKPTSSIINLFWKNPEVDCYQKAIDFFGELIKQEEARCSAALGI